MNADCVLAYYYIDHAKCIMVFIENASPYVMYVWNQNCIHVSPDFFPTCDKEAGHETTMDVDTEVAVSLAPESAVAAVLPSVQLQPTNIVLKTYTSEQNPVKGIMSVDVNYGKQHHQGLKLLMVQGGGPSLLRQDWLKVVRLDWRTIGNVSASTSGTLGHPAGPLPGSIFRGTIMHFQAKLSVKSDDQPKFFKPRPVPFVI